jgi:PAS domain S-box-containing protein
MNRYLMQISSWLNRKISLLLVLIFFVLLFVAYLSFVVQKNNFIYLVLPVFIILFTGMLFLLLVQIGRNKKINEALKLKEDHYNIILSSIGEGVIITDKRGQVLYMNTRAQQLTGWGSDEAKNQPLYKIYNTVNEETGIPTEHIMHRILKHGKKIEWENNIMLKAKDTGTFSISNNGLPLVDIKGNVSGVAVVFSDITEIKKNKTRFQQNAEQYNLQIQNLPEASYTCDASGHIQLYNRAAVALWGREPVAGKDLWCGSWKIFNKDGSDLLPENCSMAIALKEGRPVYGKEIIVQRPDKSYSHVLPYPTPLFNAAGAIIGAVNMLVDVTKRSDSEMLIQKTEEKYRSLIEQASDAILIYDFNGTIYEFNESCYTLLGYSKAAYAKLKLNDILVGDIIVNQENYAAILGGNTKTLYRYLKHKDGTLIETEVTVKLLADGKVIAFARDITERKKAEEAIKKEKELSNSIINSLPGVFYFYDENLKLLRWNKQFETVTGYSAAEIINKNPAEFFEGGEKKYMQEKSRKVFIDGAGNAEASFTTKTGKKIPFYFTGLRMQYEGKPCLLGIGIDIAERINAEAATKAIIKRYDILARATSDTIWDWDIVTNKITYNNGIYNMFGYRASKVENAVHWRNEKLHPDDIEKVNSYLEDIFKKGLRRFQLKYRFRCADGSYKYIYDRAFAIFDENGKPCRMIGAMQDITYQVQEEIRTTKAIIDAQEQERRFIGAELHDNVNQILVGSLLSLGMAKEKNKDPKKRAEFIETTKGYIINAIDEIRKLSHQLVPVAFDDILLKDIFESLCLKINVDNRFVIKLKFDEIKKDDIPDDIQVNLYRILQEQIKNILKYSEAGKIEISVTKLTDAVIMRIYDNGKGFDTKKVKKGIGLSNIKKRAESLYGKYMINSAEGKGCEIIVEIPLNNN